MDVFHLVHKINSDDFFKWRIFLKPSGYYMYGEFNIQEFYI